MNCVYVCACDPWNCNTSAPLTSPRFKWKQTPTCSAKTLSEMQLEPFPQSPESTQGFCERNQDHCVIRCVRCMCMCVLQQLDQANLMQHKQNWRQSQYGAERISISRSDNDGKCCLQWHLAPSLWWARDTRGGCCKSSPCASPRGTHFANPSSGPTQNHQPSISGSKQRVHEVVGDWKTVNLAQKRVLKQT